MYSVKTCALIKYNATLKQCDVNAVATVTACALNLPNTKRRLGQCTQYRLVRCTKQTPKRCTQLRSVRRFRTQHEHGEPPCRDTDQSIAPFLGQHSESRARATRVETMLAVLLCANCALAPGKTRPLSVRAQHGMHVQRGSRRLRSGHTGSQEPVDGFPSQKSGPQTRLGCFVPRYRDYP